MATVNFSVPNEVNAALTLPIKVNIKVRLLLN